MHAQPLGSLSRNNIPVRFGWHDYAVITPLESDTATLFPVLPGCSCSLQEDAAGINDFQPETDLFEYVDRLCR